jgi:hypothetical protein
MKDFPLPVTSHEWMRQMFASKTALDGGVIRRRISDVDRIVGRDAFFAAMRKRGFQVVENAGHFVVFCNADPVHLRL